MTTLKPIAERILENDDAKRKTVENRKRRFSGKWSFIAGLLTALVLSCGIVAVLLLTPFGTEIVKLVGNEADETGSSTKGNIDGNVFLDHATSAGLQHCLSGVSADGTKLA